MGVHNLGINDPHNISPYPGTGTVDGKFDDHMLVHQLTISASRFDRCLLRELRDSSRSPLPSVTDRDKKMLMLMLLAMSLRMACTTATRLKLKGCPSCFHRFMINDRAARFSMSSPRHPSHRPHWCNCLDRPFHHSPDSVSKHSVCAFHFQSL